MKAGPRHQMQSGFTLLELITVLGLFGIICLVAASNLKVLENPLVSGAANLSHYLRLVRVRAIAQTKSITVSASSTHRLIASSAANCDAATTTPLSDLILELDDEVSISPIDWEVCFTQRGLVQDAVQFTLSSDSGVRTVEIALGGGVEIQ